LYDKKGGGTIKSETDWLGWPSVVSLPVVICRCFVYSTALGQGRLANWAGLEADAICARKLVSISFFEMPRLYFHHGEGWMSMGAEIEGECP
jgi:hypothetical protein